MAGIFPPANKGGRPPGGNVCNGFSPTHNVVGEGPLYVAADCSTALTDCNFNAIVSELLAAVDILGVPFNADRIDNLGRALRDAFDTTNRQFETKVNRAGDTMEGPLNLSRDPQNPSEAATRRYVDDRDSALDLTLRQLVATTSAATIATVQAQISAVDQRKIERSGDTMTGPLILSGHPTVAMGAATKGYVDAHAGGGGNGGGGIPEAPLDSKLYGRRDAAWAEIVPPPEPPPPPIQRIGGRLEYVNANSLRFRPFNGHQIVVNGALLAIPSAGVTLARQNVFINGTPAQDLVAGVTYLVCLFVNGGVLTADYRTSLAHASSVTAGNVGTEIPGADDTRSVIGIVRCYPDGFRDSYDHRGVASWFNPPTRRFLRAFTSQISGSAWTHLLGDDPTVYPTFVQFVGRNALLWHRGNALITLQNYSFYGAIEVNGALLMDTATSQNLFFGTTATMAGALCGYSIQAGISDLGDGYYVAAPMGLPNGSFVTATGAMEGQLS